jgi:hypothetical protein
MVTRASSGAAAELNEAARGAARFASMMHFGLNHRRPGATRF